MGQAMSGGADEAADESLWASARQRYEQGIETVAAIAAELGMSSAALIRKARNGGWKLRGARKPKAAKTPDTIARLRNLLQLRLTELEQQIGALGAEATAASSERDIRALNGLVRTLEKVMELERKDRSRRSRERKQFRALDDAERDALAAKLAGLRRELDAAGDHQPTEQTRGGGPQS